MPLNKNSFLQSKRSEVDRLKRRLVAVDQLKSGLDENLRQLDQAADRERVRSGKAIARLAVPRILQAMEERRSNIEKTRAELEKDRKSLEQQLASAAAEVSAAEQADDHRRHRAAIAAETKDELRREQSLMRRHLRRHSAARD